MTGPGPAADRLRIGDPAALSRAITLVETGGAGAVALLRDLQRRLGAAHRLGITGPPGAGKSTLVRRLVRAWRERERPVGVIAVDPSSPLTGGALLGDRIRMEEVALDPGVFIRSMATRGALGGLALATGEVADLLDAAGYRQVVVETVGVGQSELDVMAVADTVVLVLTPESGDGIQMLKSGLMEIADLFVVNKADRPHAERLGREIGLALELRAEAAGPAAWTPPVLLTRAEAGEGISELVEAVAGHRDWLGSTGELARRRRRRSAAWTRAVVDRELLRWARAAPAVAPRRAEGEARVAAGAATPYDIAAEVLQALAAEAGPG